MKEKLKLPKEQVGGTGAELAFLKGVYNSADIGMCVTGDDHCFVLVNDAYCRTYGYERGELAGQPFTKVLPPQHLSISVNISAKHFEQPEFVERVAEVLADHDHPLHPASLKLEITESALAQDLEEISTRMIALRELGIGLSLDDFGTGYSSLAYLKRLPIGQVKIDQGFVRDLLVDENDRGITEAIIALARTLKMDVVAEGVETSAHRDLLHHLGCRIFQGYFFDRPAPVVEFLRHYGLPTYEFPAN